MIPLDYDMINDWEDLVLELDNNIIIGGRFTNMRVNRKTIPENLHAYDLRSSDEENTWICEVKDHVMVNHFGTFVTPKQIDRSDIGRIVIDFSFDSTEENYVNVNGI